MQTEIEWWVDLCILMGAVGDGIGRRESGGDEKNFLRRSVMKSHGQTLAWTRSRSCTLVYASPS
jgi:hypothetical protein